MEWEVWMSKFLAVVFAVLSLGLPALAQTATAWPQADKLFHSDPRWLGGDAAFSTDLGNGRVLWMFGDSFVARKDGATRRESAFVRNSIGVETGYDPSSARIQFYTSKLHGNPNDFVRSDAGTWLWPLHGIRLGNRLVLFYMRMTSDPDENSLGFRSVGWDAFLVDNPDEEPSQWKLRRLHGSESSGRMLYGMALLREGDYVYSFVSDNVAINAYLLRWPIAALAAGRLSSPMWWCGVKEGWCSALAQRQIVIRDAGTEFSVQRGAGGQFIEVKSQGFGASKIAYRTAPRLEGPWSGPRDLYHPPESHHPQAFVYGAKGHPELTGGDLIITYTANSSDERLASDMSIYFPRFVRVNLAH
jgi:hypothetical protein